MKDRFAAGALLTAVLVTAVSAIGCHDVPTWILETAPTWIGAVYLSWSWNSFPWTRLVIGVLTVHAIVLAVGGHFTYAEVPLGFWAKDAFGLDRNPYDRLGHFLQGVSPALLIHELVLRTTSLRHRVWVVMIPMACALAFSAIYELIEWLAATLMGQGADAFLGTQGDVWDTQADMLCALLGAIASWIFLFRWHRRVITASYAS